MEQETNDKSQEDAIRMSASDLAKKLLDKLAEGIDSGKGSGVKRAAEAFDGVQDQGAELEDGFTNAFYDLAYGTAFGTAFVGSFAGSFFQQLVPDEMKEGFARGAEAGKAAGEAASVRAGGSEMRERQKEGGVGHA